MRSIPYKIVELFVIFIIIPLSFTITYPLLVKLSIGLLGIFIHHFCIVETGKE